MDIELRDTKHAILRDGESTAQWAYRTPGFMGSLQQLTHCARCGEHLPISGKCKPRHYSNIGKSSFHVLCDVCYEALPQ